MKKTVLIVLTFCLILSLTACGRGRNDETGEPVGDFGEMNEPIPVEKTVVIDGKATPLTFQETIDNSDWLPYRYRHTIYDKYTDGEVYDEFSSEYRYLPGTDTLCGIHYAAGLSFSGTEGDIGPDAVVQRAKDYLGIICSPAEVEKYLVYISEPEDHGRGQIYRLTFSKYIQGLPTQDSIVVFTKLNGEIIFFDAYDLFLYDDITDTLPKISIEKTDAALTEMLAERGIEDYEKQMLLITGATSGPLTERYT
ncbi:MAG: hypothetical protein FWE80_09265, partial [Oscillospiraceae bacterium]|nr:hypothetical protein [Oscillospiraceae bacterium]